MTYDEWRITDPDDRYLGEGECTCRRMWRVDRWCPVHGLDPDAERDRIRDEEWR